MAELFARRFLRDDMGQDLIEYVRRRDARSGIPAAEIPAKGRV
jgi:hypothetical protein